MTNAEIRLLSSDQIVTKLTDAQHELMNLRFQVVSGQLTDTSRFKQTRRLISRFQTILNERETAARKGVA